MPLEQYRALKTQRQLWSDELRELLGETAAPETTERTPDVLLATVDNSLVAAIPFVLLAKSEQIDDTTICEHPNLFVAWDEHYTGARGDIVRDGDGVFRQIHDILDHAQNTIRPSEDTSNQLWRPLGKPGEEWPQWSRPN